VTDASRNGHATNRAKYALISPVRDEEAFIEATLRTIVGQTVPPAVWLIVSDGSRDRTDEIVAAYAQRYPFIELVRLEHQSGRNFASKVHAFNHGYGLIWHRDFEFIGNLDGDVTMEPDYYETALREFKRNPQLGIAGGIIMENVGGKYRKQDSSPRHTPGATQIFRRSCLEVIGGYLPLKGGGEDSAADIMARMRGWETHSFEHLLVYHHRRVGSGLGGVLRARFHAGITDYNLGKHPLFVMLKSLRRLAEPPPLLSSLCRLTGFICASLRGEPRLVPQDFVRYVRQEQFQRILPLRRMPLQPAAGGDQASAE
jgi:glycosyltransferase involved in cell wall biosynthesis